jgi:NADH:ubiquinone oxidoreductase subunit 5 (subunit L)/multisubunit Na+/H+ antiporter MnhA subunit
MLNNAIYKSCLFLTCGNVEHRVKTVELNRLGGLSKFMPLTYLSCLIASLSISGIPPFNGFASKWMIYQGIITNFSVESVLLRVASVVCLLVAMFGSAMTLASFVKLIHAVYLGQKSKISASQEVREVHWSMWFPCVFLAALCLLFGVFALQLPLKHFILPVLGGVSFIGAWNSGLAGVFIIAALILGWFLSRVAGSRQEVRRDNMFIGGEPVNLEESRVTGVEFYNTLKEFGPLPGIYKTAQSGRLDIYELAKRGVFALGKVFQRLHNGVLPTYMVWMLLGMMALFFVFVR